MSLRDLASTHPYSASFLLGSTLTLTFVSAAWLTKSVFFAARKTSPAAIASQVEAVWAARLEHAEQRFQTQLKADRAERAILESKLEEVLAAVSRRSTTSLAAMPSSKPAEQSSAPPEESTLAAGPHQTFTMPSERWPSPEQPSPSASLDTTSARGDGIAASREWHPGPLFDMEALARDAAKAEADRPPVKVKYPVTRHINLSRGFGRGGPLPVVDASNPNYIT